MLEVRERVLLVVMACRWAMKQKRTLEGAKLFLNVHRTMSRGGGPSLTSMLYLCKHARDESGDLRRFSTLCWLLEAGGSFEGFLLLVTMVELKSDCSKMERRDQ